MLYALAVASVSALSAAAEVPGWAYADAGQDWGDTCETGKLQSPIDLTVPHIDTSLPALVPSYCPKQGLSLCNDGRTAFISFDEEDAEEVPTLAGGPLDGSIQVREVVFHWGKHNNVGSEHTINGDHFPLEMQIFHYDNKFKDVKEAAKVPGNVVVLSVLFKVGEENKELVPVTDRMEQIENSDSEDKVVADLDLAAVLPECLDYFFYSGSLTQPGCREGVTWFVLTHTGTVSEAQMHQFRLLSKGWDYDSNSRILQVHGQRRLLASAPVPAKFSQLTHVVPEFYPSRPEEEQAETAEQGEEKEEEGVKEVEEKEDDDEDEDVEEEEEQAEDVEKDEEDAEEVDEDGGSDNGSEVRSSFVQTQHRGARKSHRRLRRLQPAYIQEGIH